MGADIFWQIQPPKLDSDAAKFMSYARVLHRIQEYAWAINEGTDPLECGAQHLATFKPRQRRKLPRKAATLMRVAWQTELAARVPGQLEDTALKKASLQTLPMQAYYVAFSIGRAVCEAAGNPLDQHASLRKGFFREHQRRFSGSWAVSLTGDPEDSATCVLDPPICQPEGFNLLTYREDHSEYLWSALRIARRRAMEEARSSWLADKQNRNSKGNPYKNLSSRARAELAARERPTTLFDLLWTMRCNTNYRSVDEYVAEATAVEVVRFHAGLMHMMEMALLHYEGMLVQYVGIQEFERALHSWAEESQKLGRWATVEPMRRAELLRQAKI